MKSNCVNRAILSISLLLSVAAMAATDDVQALMAKPFVAVNGVVQLNAEAEFLLREQLGRGVADSQELRDSVRETLINLVLMAQQAESGGLEKDALVQAQIKLARQNILAQAWQQTVLKNATITDAEIQSEYKAQVTRLGDKEVLLRHLLVSEESTAKLLIEKLEHGSSIANLAKEYSRDSATQNRGGLTDWTLSTNLLPAVAQAVAKLTKGKFTQQAVRSDLGWHILQLEDTRAFKAPSLEDLKGQLVQIISRRTIDARVKPLRDTAKVQ